MKNISKNPSGTLIRRFKVSKQLAAIVGGFALAAVPVMADVVYVSAAPLGGCTVVANCPGPNADGTYTEHLAGYVLGDFGARGTAPGRPGLRTPRGYIGGTDLTNTLFGVDLAPVLQPNKVYQIDYNFNSVAGNTTTDAVFTATSTGGTLSFTETDKFQRKYGNPANQWQLMGYITNSASTPVISFRYQSGVINGTKQFRMLWDTWRFTEVVPCLATPNINVTGPLSTNLNEVSVRGVASNATAITIYQDSGAGMVQIGTKTTGVVVSNNIVTVSGLVKNAQVAATQTIAGQEGCVPPSGVIVGGGANPSIGVAITINETTGTGPVGTTGAGNGALHFIGATGASIGAPVGALTISPSTNWQTVTLGGRVSVANTANVVGTLTNGSVYNPDNAVVIQVFPFKTVNETRIYSRTNGVAQSPAVVSNATFSVNWQWDAVEGAEGYRVVRNVGGGGFFEFIEVTTNYLVDTDSFWTFDQDPIPTVSGFQLSPSYQWNAPAGLGTVGNTNGPATAWGILESINFVIDSPNTGPFDIFIDDIQNGSTVFQTFEDAANGATDYGFRIPTFSGSSSDHILTAPDVGRVTNLTAFAGVHSFNTKFQWSGTNSQRWLRMTTSGVGNPMVNLDNPISFRILLLPVGTVIEPPAQPPTIGHSLSGSQLTLTWTGTFNLQSKDSLNDATWTDVGVSNAPFTTNVVGSAKFFRLHKP